MEQGNMTEMEVFKESIPQITELIMEVQEMSDAQYIGFKQKYMETVREIYPEAISFTRKVLLVIEMCLKEKCVLQTDKDSAMENASIIFGY